MMVLTILIVMSMIISDIIYTSRINTQLSQSAYNNLQAEYYAKSGATLALVILIADALMDKAKKLLPGADKKSSSVDSNNDIWKLLSNIDLTSLDALLPLMMKDVDGFELEDTPPPTDTHGVETTSEDDNMKTEPMAGEGNIFASDFIAEMKKDEAGLSFNIQDESNLININALQKKGMDVPIKALLNRILGGYAERKFLEDKDLTVDQIVGEMKDWVDTDEKAYNGGAEDDDYFNIEPRYKVQNAPFETIQQIRMLASMDDDLFNVLSSYLTVYPKSGDFRINANTLSRNALLSMFPEAQKNLKDVEQFYADKDKSRSPYFDNVKALKTKLQHFGVNTDSKAVKNMLKYFKVNSNYFRITVNGEVNGYSQVLTIIVKRESEKKKRGRKGQKPKGNKKPKDEEIQDEVPEYEEEGYDKPSFQLAEFFPFRILHWKMEY